MSLTYPHRLRIFAAASGSTPGGYSDDDGIWHNDPAVADTIDLYDDWADVQDGGKMFWRGTNGQIDESSDAVAFLKVTKDISKLVGRTGLKAEITWEDKTTETADVTKVRRLDGTIWLKRV